MNPRREGKKLLVLDIDYTLFDHRYATKAETICIQTPFNFVPCIKMFWHLNSSKLYPDLWLKQAGNSCGPISMSFWRRHMPTTIFAFGEFLNVALDFKNP